MTQHAAGRRGAPWDRRRLLRAVTLNGLGLLLVAAGWYGTGGAGEVRGQIAWVNIAAAGSVVVAVANGMLVLAGRRLVALRTQAYLGAVSVPEWPLTARGPNSRSPRAMSLAEDAFVAGDTMRWYHRSDCLCAIGKALAEASRVSHERAGRRPCRVCRP